MKPRLNLRIGQQITMTPQLQQAIRLLQLSTLELQTEIQQNLESNIMLEVVEDEFETDDEDSQELDFSQDDSAEESGDLNSDSSSDKEGDDTTAFEVLNDIPKELGIDSDWEDIYDGALSPYDYPTNSGEVNNKDFLIEQESAVETLQDHLRWQLELTPFSDLDRAIATAIVDAIDGDGYLRVSLPDIAKSLGGKRRVDIRGVSTVLHRIQQFDPLGVGARDLKECLLLQLATYSPLTPWLKEAKSLVRKHLELLGIHDYVQLTKRMGLSRSELREVVNLVQSLNPRPGEHLEPQQTRFIIPDVFVKKINEQWSVSLNPEISPKLRVNSYYVSLISQLNQDDNNSLKSHLQEARWFIKSLKSRHETLLKVATCIVKRQAAFLEYGEEAMKPLVLHDIASELEMHESTISRVTTHKYLHTPRGIFELKYFFSSHVSTSNGGEYSSVAIRAIIRKLIAAENVTKPFSDSKITMILLEQGINVARRTVAKYREAMVIPPSNERKRLA
jgi:RNA polymerase sigma-54 factor